jgi:hypothetical protein
MAIKVNTDPNCPGAGIASDDASLTKVSMSSIPKEDWERIFGREDKKLTMAEIEQTFDCTWTHKD